MAMKVEKHEQGRFCWAELHTTDGPGAKAFYSAVMGWEAEDSPIGPDEIYTMYKVGGETVGAQYEDKSGQAPPHWGTYITVEDADGTAARAKELGGTVLMGPFDVMEHGRMAVIQDPTGAVFSIWQPKNHIGYTLINEPGAVCWNELCTRDAVAAAAFYSGLFGYGTKESQMSIPYTEFQQGDKSIAGMMAMGPEMEGVPPHWNIYFTVANCEETFAKATELGAETIIPPMEVPGIGTMAMLRDPQGAVFAFID
jgi:predicted enzyme related to lactoylglutathione lyase